MAVARFIHVVVFLLLSLEELGLQVSQVQGRPLPLLRPVSGSLKPSAKVSMRERATVRAACMERSVHACTTHVICCVLPI